MFLRDSSHIRARQIVSWGLNAALALLALVTLWPFVQSCIRQIAAPSPGRLVRPGMPLALPGVDWSGNARHLVLVLSRGCPYCEESLGFYRKSFERIRNTPHLSFLVVSPDPTELISQWLEENEIRPDEILHVEGRELSALGLPLTPTAMLVDSTGLVTDVAIGKLTTVEETEVLSRLDVSSTAPPLFPRFALEIDEEEFRNLRSTERPTILDVRERHQHQESGARSVVNIPSREVQTRGPIELSSRNPIVIDCSLEGASIYECRLAGRALLGNGFSRVLVFSP